MFRSDDGDEREIDIELVVDDEGVVRVISCDAEEITVTPQQLATLITAVVKSMTTVGGDSGSRVDVSLN
jgi:hypothetical protein